MSKPLERWEGAMASSKDREPLRPRVMVPGTWAYRTSRALPARWFFRAAAAFYALMFVVAVYHRWWWLVAVGFMGGTSSLLQLFNLKRKAARNQPCSN